MEKKKLTKAEAAKIPTMGIHPNDLMEDCFYLKMAEAGRISEEQGRKARERLKGREDDPCYGGAMIVAEVMIENLDKYGAPCIDWCE